MHYTPTITVQNNKKRPRVNSDTIPNSDNNSRKISASSISMSGKAPSILFLCLSLMTTCITTTNSFTILSPTKSMSNCRNQNPIIQDQLQQQQQKFNRRHTIKTKETSTSLNVWWFGGQESEYSNNDEECELVAVRIERPTANSRRIMGEISVPTPIDDVWAILTDYDRLSVHVPNLVESKRLSYGQSRMGNNGEQGDGQYKCRLYQKGAQKIIGFEFGASVTMDMTESFVTAAGSNNILPAAASGSTTTTKTNDFGLEERVDNSNDENILEKQIGFKCVDSQFFSVFDGTWKVKEDPMSPGDTIVYYDVLVKPNGPVPVAALEWRIREDVPTNLRAVKKAAIEVGYDGVMLTRPNNNNNNNNALQTVAKTAVNKTRNGIQRNAQTVRNVVGSAATRVTTAASRRRRNNNNNNRRLAPVPITAQAQTPSSVQNEIEWNDDETMAVYL